MNGRIRRRLLGGIWVGLAMVLGFSAGCGDFFTPPPPDAAATEDADSPAGHSPDAAAQPVAGAFHSGRLLAFILDHRPNTDELFLSESIRRDAGRAKFTYRLLAPDQPEVSPNATTPDLVAKAVDLGAKGLIVDARPDDSDLVKALAQAHDQGVAILTLGEPIPGPDGKPYLRVRLTGFQEAGRQIVEAVLNAARQDAGFAGSRIVVLENTRSGPLRQQRLESLTSALKQAGLAWQTITFSGDQSEAERLLDQALNAKGPRVSVVLAEEDLGLYVARAALKARAEQNKSEFRIGGYFSYDVRGGPEMLETATAFGDRAVTRFAETVFKTIRAMIEGKQFDKDVELPITVRFTRTVFVARPRELETPSQHPH